MFFQVSAFLSHLFSEIADYSFTANMETEVLNTFQPIAYLYILYVLVLYHGFRNQLM